jgi:hypothetical protein
VRAASALVIANPPRRYDHLSTNFAVPLRPELDAASRDDVPDVPRELCDTWAWMKWDHGGRPQRSTVRTCGALFASAFAHAL